jgi:putative transposon-encoded protein
MDNLMRRSMSHVKQRVLGGSRGRKIEILEGRIALTDEVEIFYEKRVTPVGNSAKVDAPRRYVGKRAYVIILKK